MENNRTAQTHIGKLNIQFKAETSLAEDKSATIIPLYKNSAQFENFHDEMGAQKDFTNERGRTLVVPSKEGTKVYLNMGKPKEMNEKAAKKLIYIRQIVTRIRCRHSGRRYARAIIQL